MENPLNEQIRRNADSRNAWERFGPHRERVTRLLLEAAPAGGRLCVLGAGNCNDLDLAVLAKMFEEIHLVDWDAAAMAAGATRAGANAERIILHGGIDLTGLGTAETTVADDLIEQALTSRPFATANPFTVTASVCTLSQFIEFGSQRIGAGQARAAELILAIRARHLRLLTELTAPGGTAVLISDVVSSETYPQLSQIRPQDFAATIAALIMQGNFFTGLNPLPLAKAWRDDPQLAGMIARVDLMPPWLWDLGPRKYAVYAAVARRTGL